MAGTHNGFKILLIVVWISVSAAKLNCPAGVKIIYTSLPNRRLVTDSSPTSAGSTGDFTACTTACTANTVCVSVNYQTSGGCTMYAVSKQDTGSSLAEDTAFTYGEAACQNAAAGLQITALASFLTAALALLSSRQ